ncbi:hypothetical protein ACEWY4_021327 [Coilia grayii]|uniref:Ig-like domain-containing protein n=1 Tax=Coilia grayii TaxID=363190 RepID=A0ABD1J8R1_9TELE
MSEYRIGPAISALIIIPCCNRTCTKQYLQKICTYFLLDSHSLWIHSTFIIGDTPFPDFSAVVMLDDIQLAYYDSNIKKLIYTQSGPESECMRQEDASLLFRDQREYVMFLFTKHKLNLTRGIHIQQRLFSCELHDNDIPGQLRGWHAFNGDSISEIQFSIHRSALQAEGVWSAGQCLVDGNTLESLYASVYSPLCIKTLKNCLNIWENYLKRKVKPNIRLLQKTLPDSGGAKVTCLATGFYPRHINLTLLRNGKPVSDLQITGGELLPNGDGTYQIKKILEVSAEELLQKHHYSCTAEHLSLDNLGNFMSSTL